MNGMLLLLLPLLLLLCLSSAACQWSTLYLSSAGSYHDNLSHVSFGARRPK